MNHFASSRAILSAKFGFLLGGATLGLLLLLAGVELDTVTPKPGEFELPEVIPVPMGAIEELRHLAREDPEARGIIEELKGEAEASFGRPATPLSAIDYEGLLNTDPKRIASVQSLRQTADAALLLRYWQVPIRRPRKPWKPGSKPGLRPTGRPVTM